MIKPYVSAFSKVMPAIAIGFFFQNQGANLLILDFLESERGMHWPASYV